MDSADGRAFSSLSSSKPACGLRGTRPWTVHVVLVVTCVGVAGVATCAGEVLLCGCVRVCGGVQGSPMGTRPCLCGS